MAAENPEAAGLVGGLGRGGGVLGNGGMCRQRGRRFGRAQGTDEAGGVFGTGNDQHGVGTRFLERGQLLRKLASGRGDFET